MPTEYDITRAFKRIERELQASMIRNLKRHRAEEIEEGFDWEMWQHIQLKELERYRKANEDKFTEDFSEIDRKTEELFRRTAVGAQKKQAKYLKEKTGKSVEGAFFGVNDGKLNALITTTKADFNKAEHAVLRKANDDYRRVIFDAQVYAATGATYEQAVDMATKDFLRAGINSVVYKNGARHSISSYAEMALRTGNKRAYLMGYGNANEKYGIHTVRVNKRQNACPLCVKWLGRVLVDDVYGGGTGAEASALNVPTLSQAMSQGFLHPNCKDIYSIYIEGVSQPADPWTQEEMEEIAESYNTEAELRHAEDMADTYGRMAELSLDPENQKIYGERAERWKERADSLKAEEHKGMPPAAPETPTIPDTEAFTDAEKAALRDYVSGDGMWINQYLRGRGDFGELSELEQKYLEALTSATNKPLEAHDKLYRSVDAKAIFGDLNEEELWQLTEHLMYGDSKYDKGAYSQAIKKRMESVLSEAKGKTLTEKGFMSTTADISVAEEWGAFTGAENPVVIEFDTKGKKLKGANLDFLDTVEDPQRERLLARDTRFKIKDISVVSREDGMRYIKVEAEIVDQGAEAVESVIEEATSDVFTPASTIAEAEAYAQSLGLEASYKGVDLEVANAMNESVKRGMDYCPAVKERLQMVGSGQERNKLVKRELVDYYLNNSMAAQNAKALGYSDKQIEGMAKKWAAKAVGRIGADTYAFASDTSNSLLNGRYGGIFVNNKQAKYAQMTKSLEDDVKAKYHPEGTATVKSVFDHEMAHQIDYALGLSKNPEINSLWGGLSEKEIEDGLSRYATKNIKEFMAEGYAEYLNNPQPRELARKIGKIIEEVTGE